MRFGEQKWLAFERERLLGKSRGWLIDWLSWADPNGSYRDEHYEKPLSHVELVDAVMEHVRDSHETPEEMRAAAARTRNW